MTGASLISVSISIPDFPGVSKARDDSTKCCACPGVEIAGVVVVGVAVVVLALHQETRKD